MEVRLKEKGLSFVDGGQTLCVKCGESVGVQVESNEMEANVQIEPLQWVCEPFVWGDIFTKSKVAW